MVATSKNVTVLTERARRGATVQPDSSAAAHRAYLDAMPMAAAIVCRLGNALVIKSYNRKFERLGIDRMAAQFIHEPDRAALLYNVIDAVKADTDFEWRDGDAIEGRHFSVSIARLSPVLDSPPALLLTFIDRTLEVQTERSLRSEMTTDSLTGLLNRVGFVESLESRFAELEDPYYAIVVVDLLRFSRVNECIGSLGGDELLITVARRIMSTLRGHDQLARTGANEFAMFVRLVDGPGDVLHIARRIEDVLSRPCRLSDFEIKVDCAIGCALANDASNDAERLMRHAQIALKAAKASGRVEYYQPNALQLARRQFIIETELRRAIERDALSLAYQPLVDLKRGQVVGFEALARWKHPVIGVVPPDEFVAVAEESGLIVPLGRWAINQALRTLSHWDQQVGAPLPVYMAVNLSAIQIARDDVAATVGEALQLHGIDGARLAIELTESAIVTDPGRAGRTLEALKELNVLVAMDDFGTGFSNLASLQRMPISSLKIDRSFVTGMLDDPDKLAIVRAVQSLADALGMKTTAEGVETGELAAALARLGCSVGQGFHYARAIDADAALRFAMASLGLR